MFKYRRQQLMQRGKISNSQYDVIVWRMNTGKSKRNPVSSLNGFWSYFSLIFNKLKFILEDAPRRQERKLEVLSNFLRSLSINLYKFAACDSSTENSIYKDMKTVLTGKKKNIMFKYRRSSNLQRVKIFNSQYEVLLQRMSTLKSKLNPMSSLHGFLLIFFVIF